MTYKARVNDIDTTYKNRTVLEIVKQYISKFPDITYVKLKEIFHDDLQGSIGVLKNEKDLIDWENKEDNKKDTREKRFFSKSNETISLNIDTLYVCTQWGDSNKENIKPNFKPFIDYVRSELGFVIEDNFDELILEVKESSLHKNNSLLTKYEYYLNQILYGPPGTGKTYHTIDRALQIIDGKVPESRENTKVRFEELKGAGQIEFVTFHQSYGYEEFVEGIKAKAVDSGIEYNIEAGIFKRLADKAQINFLNSQKSTDELSKELSTIEKIEKFLNQSLENETAFTKTKGGKFYIKDLIEKRIQIFTEDSKYNQNNIELNLEEFYKIIQSDVEFSTSRQMSKEVFGIANQRQKDTYYFAMYKEFKKEPFVAVRKKKYKEDMKNYILIIDEINRGNISKIFGELITLIEKSKRLGNDEAMEVILPYSVEKFGVPKNLYIIGTMNTADRSIALMDTALRRRFEFEEMMPKPELLSEVEGIDMQQLLTKINQRIEYLYDRDHTIGHAYFMGVSNKSSLDSAMRNKVIPLLQEYFYDDWEKIQIVLGDIKAQKADDVDKFIASKNIHEDEVLGFNYEEMDENQKSYTVNIDFTTQAYKKIYE